MQPASSQLIVQMVSPAVMLSACGLMLLGLGNRYGRLVDRIRALAGEWRQLKKTGADPDRLRSVELQLPDLFRRGTLLRNALLLFCAGMACVLTGTFSALRETLLSFRLIRRGVSTPKQ